MGNKDLKFAGNDLTDINFANYGGGVKFIDTLNYYQKSLRELVSTLTKKKKSLLRS